MQMIDVRSLVSQLVGEFVVGLDEVKNKMSENVQL